MPKLLILFYGLAFQSALTGLKCCGSAMTDDPQKATQELLECNKLQLAVGLIGLQLLSQPPEFAA